MTSLARLDRIKTLGEKYVDYLRIHLTDFDSVVLADFPNYSNVGDSLIWLGELIALRRLGKPILHIFSHVDYDADRVRKLIGHRTAILISGGGNFGTLWPLHHSLRLKLLVDFPRVKLIQLPQSIFFDNQRDIERTRQALSAHGDCVVLARDHRSHEFAMNTLGCRSALIPDAAFLYSPACVQKAAERAIALRRTDKESSEPRSQSAGDLDGRHVNDAIPTFDWVAEPFDERLLLRFGALAARALNAWPAAGQRLKLALWNLHASRAVSRGEALVSRGQIVVTDRLHALLLAHLLGRKVVYVDNSYSKLSSLVSTWLAEERTLIRADSWNHAMAITRDS